MRFWAAAAVMAAYVGIAGSAWAGETILYQPAPAWVRATDIPLDTPSQGGALQPLMQNMQAYFGPDADEYYVEVATKVLTSQGLQPAGQLTQVWDPATQTLIFHKYEVIRDGKTIDQLAGDKFLVLRRENNLSMAMLDGRLTANKQIEDLRVGDIVHVAFTVRHHDPVMGGRSETSTGFYSPTPMSQSRVRVVWPKGKPVRWKLSPELGAPDIKEGPDQTELLLKLDGLQSPERPAGAPGRFTRPASLEFSDFADWKQLSALMAPLYTKAAVLSADSPLKAEAEKIRAAQTDPAKRAEAALRLVQDQVRYLYLSVGEGGYTPAAAEQTWSRRFGDCKGKTVLLLSLLNELGIKAEPALVSSRGADGLDQGLPRAGWFDHVLVRAEIDGKSYWLDGTQSGSQLADLTTPPPLDWALPLRAEGLDLVKLVVPPPAKPQQEMIFEIDASAGLDQDSTLKIDAIFRGQAASNFRQLVNAAPKGQIEKALRASFADKTGGTDIDSVDYSLNDADGSFKLTITAHGESSWAVDDDTRLRTFAIAGTSYTNSFRPRSRGIDRNAPYLLPYPAYVRQLTRIKLPPGVDGFQVVGADVDRTVAGVELKRHSQIEDGWAVVDFSYRTLVRELPADDALAAGPEFDKLATAKIVQIQAPRRLSRPDRAVQAFDQHLQKGSAFLKAKDYAKAEREFRAAESASKGRPRQARAAILSLASVHRDTKRYDEEIKDYDRGLVAVPQDAEMLNDRCWAKATRNLHVETALADCEAAVKLKPDSASYLDSLGMARLRTNDYAGAIREYEAALKKDPEEAHSLYGRGLAKRRSGDAAGGDADISAALRIDAKIAETFADYGLK